MSGLSIQHNMLMANAERQLNINTKKKAKAAEKLSSGYRINRAADDAAGLSISEKMRWMIRGLNKGTENAQDGISWVQIGDGSLEEVNSMLHRMTELAIKSSNGTSTDEERAMMQAEFAQLQKEIDRLTDNTTFNENHIFQEHDLPYHQIEGSTYWPPTQYHTVREGDNDLVITYALNENDPLETVSIKVAAGTYTTKELVDEIDTQLEKAGLLDKGVYFQYTEQGSCNLNLEGGQVIDEVSGGLSYLLYENFGGGNLGALIGTTIYLDDGSFIEVETGVNDSITFEVLNAKAEKVTDVSITLNEGKYTKDMLMQELDKALKDSLQTETTGQRVDVDHHGTGIMLSSPDFIITKFKGNMFEIDSDIRTGVFYDNVHHSNITLTPGVFKGGCVLYDTTSPGYDQGDPERQVFHIQKGVNNLLVMNPNDQGEIVIDLTNIDGNGKSMDGCTMAEMKDELDKILQPKGVEVSLNYMNTGYEYDINGNRNQLPSRYVGLTFTTTDEGPGAKVGINKAKSTAYNTLFTSRTVVTGYNKAEFGGNDGLEDENAWMLGKAKIANLEIKKDVNDEFSMQISDDAPVTIKVAAGNYDASTLATEIQNKLKDAGYDTDVINVSTSGNSIMMMAVKSEITKIRVGSVNLAGSTGVNLGFRDIFQGKDIIPDAKGKTGYNPNVKIDLTPVGADGTRHPNAAKINDDGTVYIDPKYSRLVVTIDGTDRVVNVSTPGNVWASKEALAKHITDNLKTGEKDIGCTTYRMQYGYTITNSVTKETPKDGDVVSYPPDSTYKNVVGRTKKTAGQGSSFSYEYNYGAAVTFGKALTAPIKITNDNKRFAFTLNKNSAQTVIDLSTELGKTEFSSASEFRDALQKAINKKLGKEADQYGGVKVSLDGNNRLVLTAGLMSGALQMSGQDDTKITMDTSKGTFVWDLHKQEVPASVSLTGSTQGVNYSFKTKGEPTIALKLTEPGKSAQNITIKLKKDYQYTSHTDLLNDLNSSEKLGKYGIKASISGDKLVFSTSKGGTGYKLDVTAGGTAEKFLFGYKQEDGSYTMDGSTPYKIRTYETVKTGFTLSTDAERKFTINIDGTNVTKSLAAKKYNSAAEVAAAIESAFGASVVKVTADSYGRLVFESGQKGSGHTISLSYNANSSMKKIFGTTPTAGAEASISDDGTLTLTRIGGPASGYGSISVTSHDIYDTYQGGSFIFEKGTDYADPDYEDGYHSGMNSYMDGVDLKFNANGKIDIKSWNNEMTFYYAEDYEEIKNTKGQIIRRQARPKEINISITPVNDGYSMEELRDVIQQQIDAQTGAQSDDQRKMIVSVTKAGVRIEAKNRGSKYRIFQNTDSAISSPDNPYVYKDLRPAGTFFDKIMCSAVMGTAVQKATNVDGKQNGNEVYTVGRQDVRNHEVRIQKDGNDQLSLEFSTPDKTYTLQMVLDPGYYRDGALARQIQKQLNKALKENGLPEGLIEVGVGTVDTKVEGANDKDALAFRLSNKVKIPEELLNGGNGKYGIEAVGGTAAFSVFYATDGDIARAYVKGGKDISNGVEIKQGKTTFSVDVDDEHYEIELTPKKYTAKELIDHINELLEADDVPLTALEDGGRLKLMHANYGKHKINHLSGEIKNALFFGEKGNRSGKQPMRLRVSGVSGDWIEVDKPWMDTTSLGINTLTVEKFKNAQKAITRLKKAVTKASEVRSYFGAMQNRLESTVRNNQNQIENTTAAESRIRDADVANEVMENAIHNILEQTGVSMLAQTKQNAQLALQLLS